MILFHSYPPLTQLGVNILIYLIFPIGAEKIWMRRSSFFVFAPFFIRIATVGYFPIYRLDGAIVYLNVGQDVWKCPVYRGLPFAHYSQH